MISKLSFIQCPLQLKTSRLFLNIIILIFFYSKYNNNMSNIPNLLSIQLQRLLINSQKYHKFLYGFQSLIKQHTLKQIQDDLSFLFFSYCLSIRIEEVISHKIMQKPRKCIQSLQNLCCEVFKDEDFQFFMLKVQENWDSQQQRKMKKDRKTSFFRTIIKYLRSHQSLIAAKGKKVYHEVIVQIQKKLSKNTISTGDIKQLCLVYGDKISEYLNSKQVYEDFLNINKSKVNKAYYMLHLRSIGIIAQQGKLHEFSFFTHLKFSEKIKSIVRTLASREIVEKIQNPQILEDQRLDYNLEDKIYKALNLDQLLFDFSPEKPIQSQRIATKQYLQQVHEEETENNTNKYPNSQKQNMLSSSSIFFDLL